MNSHFSVVEIDYEWWLFVYADFTVKENVLQGYVVFQIQIGSFHDT